MKLPPRTSRTLRCSFLWPPRRTRVQQFMDHRPHVLSPSWLTLRLPHCLLPLRADFLLIAPVGLSVAAYSAQRCLTRSWYASSSWVHASTSCQSQCQCLRKVVCIKCMVGRRGGGSSPGKVLAHQASSFLSALDIQTGQ